MKPPDACNTPIKDSKDNSSECTSFLRHFLSMDEGRLCGIERRDLKNQPSMSKVSCSVDTSILQHFKNVLKKKKTGADICRSYHNIWVVRVKLTCKRSLALQIQVTLPNDHQFDTPSISQSSQHTRNNWLDTTSQEKRIHAGMNSNLEIDFDEILSEYETVFKKINWACEKIKNDLTNDKNTPTKTIRYTTNQI